ncbi:LysR family transcriptional regulator [Bacillus paralicheniformis]|uniref:LysR family transcriptional regulator n=1 Tax=Bacillus paralicheniformis TaxID=1648923 RepID=UPI000BA6BD66|nr:LysR family transcriptional regulator [Bacillus paralicheniformis]MBZ5216544.1 LysR family transcriptional regulator [Bacillus paralicheniformis]MCB6219423.1 LysR family transcriptional regulator [Bacillus paralicheniformis]MED1713256.1 LysR family transcriptional regulator [Bacillus paralicheniformis]PAC95357.1 LysR family transcriptional regulator [Bacillus paralicheniformis]WHX86991.1 LysR family transcriptional regulator [Bacillus paralicheniformis]
MNLHALRLFYSVAETGSVTQAAKQLNISQPAVTSQIKKLEREIDCTLFVPKGRGILLTQSGAELAKQAKRLFSLEKEIELYVEQLREGSIGKLRIAATFLPANYLLPRWLSRYKQQFPKTEVEITTTNFQKACEQLINYEADIGLIGGTTEFDPFIKGTLLLEDDMLFVVNKNHRLASQYTTLEEVVKEPFIFREEGSLSREKLISLCTLHHVDKPRIGIQINGLNETIRTVMEGYGVAFTSSLEVNEYIDRGDIARVHVEQVDLKNPISLCIRRDDHLAPSASNFIQMIQTASYRP